MPVTFPDGTTAELLYAPDLALEELSVYPDAFAKGGPSACGLAVYATRYDPHGVWIRGDAPSLSLSPRTDPSLPCGKGLVPANPGTTSCIGSARGVFLSGARAAPTWTSRCWQSTCTGSRRPRACFSLRERLRSSCIRFGITAGRLYG